MAKSREQLHLQVHCSLGSGLFPGTNGNPINMSSIISALLGLSILPQNPSLPCLVLIPKEGALLNHVWDISLRGNPSSPSKTW